MFSKSAFMQSSSRIICPFKRKASAALSLQEQQCSFLQGAQFSSTSMMSEPPKEEEIAHDWQTNIHNRVLLRHLGDGIYNVRLNRPEKMNALDMQMFESIGQAAQLLRDSRTSTTTSSTVTTTTTSHHHPRIETPVRAIILNGQGKAFCTGLDVKGMLNVKNGNPKRHLDRLLTRPSGYQRNDDKKDSTSNMLEREKDTVLREVPAEDTTISSPTILGNLAQDVSYLWRDIDVPVIASVHGMCFGGGMQIALGADMRFATTDCRLSIMESKWGLIPDMTASITLRELVRIDIAKELTMTGRIVSGREGESLGLVTRCVEDPFEESLKVAKEIVARWLRTGFFCLKEGRKFPLPSCSHDDTSRTKVNGSLTYFVLLVIVTQLSRSPDSPVAASKRLFQNTWVAEESVCLTTETQLQKQMIASWNQLAASGRNFGVNLPYRSRMDFDES